MEFTRMNAEQMRRKAIQNSKEKEQQSKDYQNQIDNMSKHNVGGLFDLKSIKKAQSTKVIQERFYDQDRVNKKFESFLGHHGLYKVRGIIEDKIKKTNGGDLTVYGMEDEIKYLDDVLTEKENHLSKN